MSKQEGIERPAWWPTQEQKERADKACADAVKPNETNAAEYVETSKEDLISTLANLERLAQGEGPDEFSNDELLSLGIGYGVPGALPAEQVQEEAQEAVDQMPLAVEATTTFGVVLGIGGPNRRLCFECEHVPDGTSDSPYGDGLEIRRVFYRYSWEGSAEVELTGEDREIAEAFGRRVVPELVE